jgi:hypothetical protein
MRPWGRIVGAALGIPAGIPGVAFGFLVGFLIDKAFENRGRSVRFERFLSRPEDTDVDKRTGVLYLAVGLLAESPGGVGWSEGHQALLAEAGGKPVAESQRRQLVATAAARPGFSLRGGLAWARQKMSAPEAVALTALVLLPPGPEKGANPTQVQVARRVADALRLTADKKREAWNRARPLPRDAAALLGVGEAADARELQGAYRLLASQFHPDSLAVFEEPQRKEATEAFVRIRGAYDRLRPLVTAWFSDAP